MQSLHQKTVPQQRAARSMVPKVPASSQMPRPVTNVLPKPAGLMTAPFLRARLAHETRRLATALVARAGPVADGFQERTNNPLPIIFVSAEVAPWSKTGGLGDVLGGLPIELAKRGHKVMTIAPRYDQYSDAWDTSKVIDIDGEKVRFFHSIKKGVHRVWVDHPSFLAKVWGKTGSMLYGPKTGADYVDNHKRFAMFNKAAIEASRVLPFGFGEDVVFVANDWHSSLVPVLISKLYKPKGQFVKAKTALCIHNIAFQGRMWEDAFRDMKLPQDTLSLLSFQDGNPRVYSEKDPLTENEQPARGGGKYSKINWLKAGILTSDRVLTVSPNYAREISADESGGVELDSLIRQKGGCTGIVNGMDTEEWDPRVDKYLPVPYDKTNVYAGKAAAKENLQADVGLPINPNAPLFAFIGRLEEQKGVDILVAAIPQLLDKSPNAQVVILGTGKAKFEKALEALDRTGRGRVKCVIKFSAPLAHVITAGADFILVPSRFEPCGLIQLHAMQYGTVPVVASTGGLVDTVKEGVTGFHMGALDKDRLDPADASALASTAARAAQAYSTPLFKSMVYNCISQDLSWAKPAKKWEGVLEQMFLGLTSGIEKEVSVQIPVREPIPGPIAATDKPLSPGVLAAKSMGSGTPASSSSNGTSTFSAPRFSRSVPASTPAAAPTTATPVSTPAASPAAAPVSTPASTPATTTTPSSSPTRATSPVSRRAAPQYVPRPVTPARTPVGANVKSKE